MAPKRHILATTIEMRNWEELPPQYLRAKPPNVCGEGHLTLSKLSRIRARFEPILIGVAAFCSEQRSFNRDRRSTCSFKKLMVEGDYGSEIQAGLDPTISRGSI
jgi:hypothetical protein